MTSSEDSTYNFGMVSQNYLTTAALNEIVRYNYGSDLGAEATRFRGAVRKHPYDHKKFLLITKPLEDASHFYEFKMEDVVRVGDLSRIVTEEGETVQLVEVSVRKGSVGIEMHPFEVR